MPKTIFDLSVPELVDSVAFRADAAQEYLRAVGEIHQMMRINYQELIHHVGRKYLSPDRRTRRRSRA